MEKMTKKPNINRSLSFLIGKADDKIYVKLGSEKVALPEHKIPVLFYAYFTRNLSELFYIKHTIEDLVRDKIYDDTV